MKYIPNDQNDRKFIGRHWNKRMIRGIQCILNSSHGIVPIKLSFFNNAFGKDIEEFTKIIQMPENYIIYRKLNYENIINWNYEYENLNEIDKKIVLSAISLGKNRINQSEDYSSSIKSFLNHYKNESK